MSLGFPPEPLHSGQGKIWAGISEDNLSMKTQDLALLGHSFVKWNLSQAGAEPFVILGSLPNKGFGSM